MSQFDDAKALVESVEGHLPDLIKQYDAAIATKQINASLKIQIKNAMENLRSALDYSAHALQAKYGKPNSTKIYFPYIEVGGTKADFLKQFDKCMPGVRANKPNIAEMMESWQPSSGSNNNWLPEFMKLNNKGKHQELTPHIFRETQSMQITSSGGARLVAGAIHIRGGGKMTVDGKEIGAGSYGPENLPPVPPTAKAEVVTWTSIHFQLNNQPVVTFIKDATVRIKSMVENMAAVYSGKPS